MSLSGLSFEDALHRINAWLIDDCLFRFILLASPGIILVSRGRLRWRTDTALELSWLQGSIAFPVDETVRFSGCDPFAVSAAYPEFADIGGGEARYSDCLEIRFSFGRLLLLRFDLSMFDD